MEKILISACLLGENCTYKGGNNKQDYVEELNRYFDLVPFCPEVEGGLPTPRKPSEGKGFAVVYDDGTDVTEAFRTGAYKATSICSFLGIRYAILKERSPSCGVHEIYDGFFRGKTIKGEGVTTAALRRMGVKVMNEEEGRAFLEDHLKNQAIKDERTALAKAKEAEPKTEEEQPKEKALHGKPGYSFQGKTRPFAGRGDKKPWEGKKKPFKARHKPYGNKPEGESEEGHEHKKPFGNKGPRKPGFGRKPGPRKPFKKPRNPR